MPPAIDATATMTAENRSSRLSQFGILTQNVSGTIPLETISPVRKIMISIQTQKGFALEFGLFSIFYYRLHFIEHRPMS